MSKTSFLERFCEFHHTNHTRALIGFWLQIRHPWFQSLALIHAGSLSASPLRTLIDDIQLVGDGFFSMVTLERPTKDNPQQQNLARWVTAQASKRICTLIHKSMYSIILQSWARKVGWQQTSKLLARGQLMQEHNDWCLSRSTTSRSMYQVHLAGHYEVTNQNFQQRMDVASSSDDEDEKSYG